MSDCRHRPVAPWADLPFTEKGLDFSEPIKNRHPFGWRSFIGLFHDEYRAFDVVDDILTDTPHDEGGDSALAAVADDDHIDALLLYDLRNSGTRDAGLYDLFIVELIGISSFSAASSLSALALILMKPFLSKVTPMIG